MISLERIATDIAAELQEVFSTVRICAVQNPEQFLTEIRAINPEKLPAVLIVFDGFCFYGRIHRPGRPFDVGGA